jgi:hypothetical protein
LGDNHAKTPVVVPVIRVVVVTNGAPQSARIYSGSSPPGQRPSSKKQQKAKRKRQKPSWHSAGIFFISSTAFDSKKSPAE